ncbi:nuclear factor NF-kappa-B p110 subunit-like [Coccinella septempunctata]|uniref:nuclear factor NF-kappa-B p110 subunit-like n=1 Tax=Coccinella septempunctata TaxID=41139 RepID=UPI001D086C70|nr:nuclear factor NF-kappa-B p110 subunit-like [Coccinella septempunctata]
MSDMKIEYFSDMLNYPVYPSPPSTSEDSPISYTTLSPPSYMSESSSSPGILQSSQLVLVPQNVSLIPYQASDKISDAYPQSSQPYLEITEEPIDRFRFRYKSEMTGTHGCLNGERSDKTRKMTYPSVKLHNYKGSAIIRCSIWQINHNGNDFMPHAHRLVKKRHGKEEADDPHEITVNENTGYEASFFSMGIIHTAKKNIVSELIKKKTALMKELASRTNREGLSKKEEMEIKGLAEAESKSINLNVVCLRFDAFLAEKDVRFPICTAVFSHAINNLKSALTGELKIVRMDHCTSPATGGREIFLLVERVTKKNIKVRFYELDEKDDCLWEDFGKFNDLDVHHQYAIVFRTPAYKNRDIGRPVNVFMELVRPSDNARSEPKEFQYTPASNYGKPGSKRARPNDFDSSEYDTASSAGSAGSVAIPRTIENMSNELNDIRINDIDSEELNKLINDINSDEFREIFNKNKSEYESAIFGNSDSFSFTNISMDFPVNNITKRNYLLSSTLEQSHSYKKKVVRVVQEITEYLRTKPSDENDTIKHIKHYLSNLSGGYNALHLAAMIGDVRTIELFIKLIVQYKLFEIVNIPTKTGQGTALHIAVVCGDVELARSLITNCQADISVVDNNLNTPLHLASEDASGNMTECLMRSVSGRSHIDLKNKSGNTALHIAVKRGNLKAVKILYRYGADVNARHLKSGFTPLRFAVERKDVEIIKFLLHDTNSDPKKPDFAGVTPIQVIHQMENLEVVELIKKYESEHNSLCEDIEIKMEPEDDDSEAEKEIFEEEVKAEPLPLGEDYQNFFQTINHFTDECLDDISKEIDSSGKWEDLAQLLDIGHLIRMETIGENSPGKRILEIATQVATVKEIRGFLENLDETKAVQAIDRMALQIYNSSSPTNSMCQGSA